MADALAEMEPLQPLPLETYTTPPPSTFDNVSFDPVGRGSLLIEIGMGPYPFFTES